MVFTFYGMKVIKQTFFNLQVRQKARLDRQRDLAQKIVKSIKEIDDAKQLYQQKLLATEEERKAILDSKLKPKGKLWAKKG